MLIYFERCTFQSANDNPKENSERSGIVGRNNRIRRLFVLEQMD
jgi:hypothetical protein